jgi:hypothetical protein
VTKDSPQFLDTRKETSQTRIPHKHAIVSAENQCGFGRVHIPIAFHDPLYCPNLHGVCINFCRNWAHDSDKRLRHARHKFRSLPLTQHDQMMCLCHTWKSRPQRTHGHLCQTLCTCQILGVFKFAPSTTVDNFAPCTICHITHIIRKHLRNPLQRCVRHDYSFVLRELGSE